MTNTQLRVNNLGVSYRNFSLNGVSFELQSGDVMGFVGQSGSGKSTIIKSLLGMVSLRSGTIQATHNGISSPLSSLIGYSPQDNALYPFLTVRENIVAFGEFNGVRKAHIEKRMSDLLLRLQLTDAASKKIIELSGGMQKRVDLAVSLIHDPEIIILDEPFNGLDISLQRFIWELLKELAQSGKIVLISSHILGDIQKNCNQLGLVHKGGFYNTVQVKELLKSNRTQSLETCLSNLFRGDAV